MANLFSAVITTAATVTSSSVSLQSALALAIQANFIYGSGGTSVDAYVQTTLDGGLTWIDIAEFSFAGASLHKVFNLSALTVHTTQITPTDGALTANTAVDGVLGNAYRVKVVSVGTYANTTLAIDLSARPLFA